MTCWSPACRGRQRRCRPRTTATWRRFRPVPARTAGKAVGAAAAAGMLALRTGDHFDDVVPYVQPTPGPGVFEPIAPTTPVDVKLGKVRPFTYETPAYRPDAALRAHEQAATRTTWPSCRRSARNIEHRADPGADRDRSLLHRPDLRAVQPRRCAGSSTSGARPARVRAAARVHVGRGRGHDDRLLGGEVPLHTSGARTTRSSGPTPTGTRPRRPTRPGCRSSRATTPSTRPATPASPPR